MAEHTGHRLTHAYVLIGVEPAQTQRVLQRLKAISGAQVHEVLGPYDMVIELEVEAPEYITMVLREKIRTIPGILSTVTCTWIE